MGKALSKRAKLYRKHRAGPNFVVQLIDSGGEFTIDSGCLPGRVREERCGSRLPRQAGALNRFAQ
jgi:hypothetical protein